jgi:hypothetical protein
VAARDRAADIVSEAWRISELRTETQALRAQITAQEAAIERLEQIRAVADAAWGEHCAKLREITDTQFTIRRQVDERGTETGADGYPRSGPTGSEQAFYDGLEDARAQELQRYQRWRDERRIEATDGGIDRSWSTRDPLAVDGKIAALKRVRAVTGQRLGQVEDEIAALEAAEMTPASATDEPSRSGLSALASRVFGG